MHGYAVYMQYKLTSTDAIHKSHRNKWQNLYSKWGFLYWLEVATNKLTFLMDEYKCIRIDRRNQYFIEIAVFIKNI